MALCVSASFTACGIEDEDEPQQEQPENPETPEEPEQPVLRSNLKDLLYQSPYPALQKGRMLAG